ncbi:hypothetical protein C7999DRAFT_41648 [Corynascus novoguineensis]|uniref:Uncharacterized protein n=1 Tax=Corynascus novoguineensis TaxID=1126955 RepID=A0AAN7HMV3_9PEZI|nr:hypothetical protein C7999DRAFT_41648 [Corynascus novoguineensis]
MPSIIPVSSIFQRYFCHLPPAIPLWFDFHFWRPPEDPERPPLPYTSVFTITITEHVPPRPFGLPSVYPFIEPPYDTCPPLEADNDTDSAVPEKPAEATLKLGKPFQAVAKIFDPLYYSFKNESAPHRPVATTLAADSDYSIEATAYTYLQKRGHTGGFAPDYYGSWTFTLPIRHRGIRHERHVRLLLMEYIDGVCIRDLCYRESASLGFTEEHRLDVLARILDGDVRLEHSGINQRDLLPPNIMLKLEPKAENSLGKGRPRVVQRAVLIDYNISMVYHLAPEALKYRKSTELPLNPIDMIWSTWQGNQRAQQEWLIERFGGQNALAYAPVSRELVFDDA